MRYRRITLATLSGLLVWSLVAASSHAASLPGLSLNLSGTSSPAGVVGTLQIIVLLALLSFAPAILVMMTAFTRVIVILSFVRSALATQSAPPNQVLIGLALFLTLFIMSPTFTAFNNQALQPYLAGRISQSVAIDRGELPFKEFMAKQTRIDDVELFLQYQHLPLPNKLTDLPITTLVPAFAISELKTAFQIGFMIYIPFLIVDLVVATTLMSMNMMMLPPVLISTPFKLLLFVMVNGWYLVVKSILAGFH